SGFASAVGTLVALRIRPGKFWADGNANHRRRELVIAARPFVVVDERGPVRRNGDYRGSGMVIAVHPFVTEQTTPKNNRPADRSAAHSKYFFDCHQTQKTTGRLFLHSTFRHT